MMPVALLVHDILLFYTVAFRGCKKKKNSLINAMIFLYMHLPSGHFISYQVTSMIFNLQHTKTIFISLVYHIFYSPSLEKWIFTISDERNMEKRKRMEGFTCYKKKMEEFTIACVTYFDP